MLPVPLGTLRLRPWHVRVKPTPTWSSEVSSRVLTYTSRSTSLEWRPALIHLDLEVDGWGTSLASVLYSTLLVDGILCQRQLKTTCSPRVLSIRVPGWAILLILRPSLIELTMELLRLPARCRSCVESFPTVGKLSHT
jgi:hypothetical protein